MRSIITYASARLRRGRRRNECVDDIVERPQPIPLGGANAGKRQRIQRTTSRSTSSRPIRLMLFWGDLISCRRRGSSVVPFNPGDRPAPCDSHSCLTLPHPRETTDTTGTAHVRICLSVRQNDREDASHHRWSEGTQTLVREAPELTFREPELTRTWQIERAPTSATTSGGLQVLRTGSTPPKHSLALEAT